MFLCYFFVVLFGVFCFFFNKSHFLKSILSLELCGVGVFGLLSISMILVDDFFFYIYLVMLVVETSLGLSVLVNICGGLGDDMISSGVSVVC